MTRSNEPVETPWGSSTVEIKQTISTYDGYRIDGLSADTSSGNAKIMLNVSVHRDTNLLRLTMLSGFRHDIPINVVQPGGDMKGAANGNSWLAQAYIDPATGLPADGREILVNLPDANPAMDRDALGRVRASIIRTVRGFIAETADSHPGYAAAAYAAIAKPMLAMMEQDIETKEAEARNARKDRVRLVQEMDAKVVEAEQAVRDAHDAHAGLFHYVRTIEDAGPVMAQGH